MSDEPLTFGTGDNWLLVHTDPFSGKQTYIMDLKDGNTAIRTVVPVDQILESAADDRSANAGKKWGDGQIIGTVPLSVALQSGYSQAKQNGDTAWIKRFWNDSDNAKLRTFHGKI